MAEAPGGFIYCLDDIRTKILDKNIPSIINNPQSEVEFDIITLIDKDIFPLKNYNELIKTQNKKEKDTIFQKNFLEVFYDKLILINNNDKIFKLDRNERIDEIQSTNIIKKDLYEYFKENISRTKNSGDILDENMIDKLYTYYKINNKKADIITADGGFDILDEDKKYEEYISAKLHFGQIITALLIQEKGGVFILKIKGMYSKLTTNLLYILAKYYTEIKIIKPYTSKVFNNEKYIKCYNFKGIQEDQIEAFKDSMLKILRDWNLYEEWPLGKKPPKNDEFPIININDVTVDYENFKYNINNINNSITIRQYYYYKHLHNLIKMIEDDKTNELQNIFNEYCYNYKNLKKLINNEILKKYIMYPLKMSLILCNNINLKTIFEITENTEKILSVLEQVAEGSEELEPKIFKNPYIDEINNINSLSDNRKRNYMRNIFIKKNCVDLNNSDYIRYNLYNQIQNLRYIITKPVNENPLLEIQNSEKYIIIEFNTNKYEYSYNDIWDKWLINNENTQDDDYSYFEINKFIKHNIKEILKSFNNSDKDFKKKYGIQVEKFDEFNNIISNIKKF